MFITVMKTSSLTMLLFLFLTVPIFPAAFDLTAEANGGYESAVYIPEDSAFSGAWFTSVGADPLLTLQPLDGWHSEFGCPLSATFRASAGRDLSVEPGFARIREQGNKSLTFKAAAAYEKQPGSQDPDLPLENMLYKASIEHARRGASPLKLSLALHWLDELGSSRNDLKLKGRLRMNFKSNPAFMPGFGLGLGSNLSNTGGYDYTELDLSLNATLLSGAKNMFLASLYWNTRLYPMESGTGSIAGTAKSRNKKGGSTGGETSASNQSTFTLTFIRELSGRLDFEASYDYSRFPGSGADEVSTSHALYGGFSFRLNSL